MNIVEKIRKDALEKWDIKIHYLFYRYVNYGLPKDLILKNLKRHKKTNRNWFKASLEAK